MAKAISVSQVNGYISKVLSTDPILSRLSVCGEVSGFKVHAASGHVYFSLKDDKSKLNCFLLGNIYQRLNYSLEDGLMVVARGKISVYERGGYYSLQVDALEIEGQGNLAIAFDKLKNRLRAEGLFDERHKKKLPKFTSSIALITSKSGAVIDDMLRIIRLRNSLVNVFVVPVLVQGEAAARDIAEAIHYLNESHSYLDVLVVARGGGSIEDLWAFNEEVLARAIFESQIPVVSAVGHEVDYTIADFVADLRAQTPTEAASLVTFDESELRASLDVVLDMVHTNLNRRLASYEGMIAKVEQAGERLKNKLILMEKDVVNALPISRIILLNRIESSTKDVDSKLKLAKANNPLNIMSKGYSIIYKGKQIVLKSDQVDNGEKLVARLYSGELELEVRRRLDLPNSEEKI